MSRFTIMMLFILPLAMVNGCKRETEPQTSNTKFTEDASGQFLPESVANRAWCFSAAGEYNRGIAKFGSGNSLTMTQFSSQGPRVRTGTWSTPNNPNELQINFSDNSIETLRVTDNSKVQPVYNVEQKKHDGTTANWLAIPVGSNDRGPVSDNLTFEMNNLAGKVICAGQAGTDELGIMAFTRDGKVHWTQLDGKIGKGQYQINGEWLTVTYSQFGYVGQNQTNPSPLEKPWIMSFKIVGRAEQRSIVSMNADNGLQLNATILYRM